MAKIILNDNNNRTVLGVNGPIYPILLTTADEVLKYNYGTSFRYGNIAYSDLNKLSENPDFDDPRMASSSGIYGYSNYAYTITSSGNTVDNTLVDKIPVELGFNGLKDYVDVLIQSNDLVRENNLIKFYSDVILGDFTIGFHENDEYQAINKDNFIAKLTYEGYTKSYILTPYKFIKVTNAPKELQAYLNIRGVLFKMNKIEYYTKPNSTTGTYTFQYPAFLVETIKDLDESVLCIEFNLDLTADDAWSIPGFTIEGCRTSITDVSITPTEYSNSQLAYFNLLKTSD